MKCISKSTFVLYSIPVLISLVIFQNHYSRDTVGALEKQLESDLHISPAQYATLNSIFFIPNIFAPLFTGFLSDYFKGAARLQLFVVILASFGHVLFAFGAQVSNLPLFFLGRFIAGSIYELMDCLPIIFLGPLFKEEWGVVCGLINGFLRLGSVFCFLLNPYFYTNYGVRAALWASAGLACLSVVAAVAGLYFYRIHMHAIKKSTSGVSLDSDGGLSSSSSHHGDVVAEYNVMLTSITEEGEEDLEAGQTTTDTDSLSHVSSDTIRTSSSAGNRNSSSNNSSSSGDGHSLIQLRDRTSSAATDDDAVHPQGRYSQDKSSDTHNGDSFTDSSNDHNGPIGCIRSMCGVVLKYLPVHEYGTQFHSFNLASCCLYGAMVPFWFLGSKFLQVNYHLSVGRADALMLLPEGVMVILSPTAGYLMDRYKPTLKTELAVFSLSCTGQAISYLMLAYGFHAEGDISRVMISPLLSMSVLGVCYAVSNSIVWVAIIAVISERHLASGSGVVASCMNILPSIIPHLILAIEGTVLGADNEVGSGGSSVGLFVLTVCALCAALFAYLSSIVANINDTPAVSTTTSKSSNTSTKKSTNNTAHGPTDGSNKESASRNEVINSLRSQFSVSASDDHDDDDDDDNDGVSNVEGGVEMLPTGRGGGGSSSNQKYASLGTGDYDD